MAQYKKKGTYDYQLLNNHTSEYERMISVAMATFNGEKYIERQLKSILENLSHDDQVVISDDGSTDNTLSIIKSFNDNRIEIIDGPQCGINANFENAIIKCKGEYVFLCDQDDFWYSNKVSEVCKVFKTTHCTLVLHDAVVKDENNNVLYDSFFGRRHMRTGLVKNILKNCYHGCLMAFDRKLINDIIPIPREGCLHDQWIGIVNEMCGTTFFLNQRLMEYVRHGENASSYECRLPFIQQVRNRIEILKNVFFYAIKSDRREED